MYQSSGIFELATLRPIYLYLDAQAKCLRPCDLMFFI
jgi:hypothetical protein